MPPVEVYRLLTQQIRRGLVIFPCLWLASILSASVLFLIPAGRPWAVTLLLISICIGVGIAHVRKRENGARKVSAHPELVYWAHSIQRFQRGRTDSRDVGNFSNDPISDCTLCKVHLRDGTDFEVNLPASQMRVFLAWLSEHNSGVRLDDYDSAITVETSRKA